MLLLFAIIAGCMVLMPAAWWLAGTQGGIEVGSAALVCLLSGLLALAVTSMQTLRRQPLAGMLFAMAIRLLPPLVVCLALSLRDTGAKFSGFVCYLLLFYLISLAIETYLSVQQVQSVD